MINKLFKHEVHQLNKLDKRYRLEVEETIDNLIIKLYLYDDNSMAYLLRGRAMTVNKNMEEFRSDDEFKLIKNSKLKSEIIKIACDYCNIQVTLGGIRYESNSEYVQ